MREWRGEDNHEAEPSTASPERTNQLVASTYSAPKNLRKRWQKGDGDRESEAAGRIRMSLGSTVTTAPIGVLSIAIQQSGWDTAKVSGSD